MRIVEAEDVAAAAAAFLADRLRGLTADGRPASIAVSGGTTPWPMLAALAKVDLPWDRIDIYQVDERIAPAGDPARNLTRLAEIFASVPAALHPMPVEASDLDGAAADYATTLPPVLDIVQLGLGGDGHTASLVPGDPVLDVTDRDVAVTEPYQGHRRMTLTYPAINRAGLILWLVAGAGKSEALAALLAGDPNIPAGRIGQDQAVLFADSAALGSGRL